MMTCIFASCSICFSMTCQKWLMEMTIQHFCEGTEDRLRDLNGTTIAMAIPFNAQLAVWCKVV